MSKGIYLGGSSGTAQNVKSIYIGVNGVARKVIAGYIGVNGVARQFYPSVDEEYSDEPSASYLAIYDRSLIEEINDDNLF